MNDFDIISVIGRGYFGKVMLVKEKKKGRLYSIKSKLIEKNNLQSIATESWVLEKVKHPFIVSL